MTQTIVHKLLSFYPELNRKNIKIQQNEYDENCYEVLDNDDSFLFITLTEDGILEDFSIDEDYFPGNQTFAKETIVQKAVSLLDALIEEDRQSLHLSSIINFDNFWFIEFTRKDPYLNLELPNSGASIYINRNGIITSANFEIDKIGIEKPEPQISSDEAKALYIENLKLMPIIMKIDSDYIDGDDAYHFVYYVTDNIMAIEMDGTLQTVETYGGTYPKYEKIMPTKRTFNHLYEAIGIPKHFTKVYEDELSEQWSPGVITTDDDGDFLDIEYDSSKNVCHINFIPDYETLSNVKAQDLALEKAISFLTFHFQDAATRFRLIIEDHVIFHDDENEEESSKTCAYHFNFQQFERDVLVATEPISITVDAENLMITHFRANETHHLDFSTMDLTCTYPKELAEKAYAEKLMIEKSWSKEVGKDSVIYQLIYSYAFPETVGTMRAIDAKTGKTWFIDASCIDEF